MWRAGGAGIATSDSRILSNQSSRRRLFLLRDLDAVDQSRWVPVQNKDPDIEAVAVRYREALGRFGADPETVGVETAAARVKGSFVCERLVTALNRLLRAQKSAAVRAALQAIDPDPFRDRLNPKYAWPSNNLGLVLTNKGDFDGAIAACKQAIRLDPKLAEDLKGAHRYEAARSAALAGCDKGADATKRDDKDRARLRGQVLTWLRADLVLRRQASSEDSSQRRDTVRSGSTSSK